MRRQEERVDFLQIAILLQKWKEHYQWAGLFLSDISNIETITVCAGYRIAPNAFVVREGKHLLEMHVCIERDVAYFRLLPDDYKVPEKGWVRLRSLDRRPHTSPLADVSREVPALLFGQLREGRDALDYNSVFPVTCRGNLSDWKPPSSYPVLISFIKKSLHPDFPLGL